MEDRHGLTQAFEKPRIKRAPPRYAEHRTVAIRLEGRMPDV